MSLAENLKKLREAAELSQGELAARAKVSQQLISRIENGVDNSTKKLPQIARALGCKLSDLSPDFLGIESGPAPAGAQAPADHDDMKDRTIRLWKCLGAALELKPDDQMQILDILEERIARLTPRRKRSKRTATGG